MDPIYFVGKVVLKKILKKAMIGEPLAPGEARNGLHALDMVGDQDGTPELEDALSCLDHESEGVQHMIKWIKDALL